MTHTVEPTTRPADARPDVGGFGTAAPGRLRRAVDSARVVAALHGIVLLVVTFLVLSIVRLPWIGDLGVHAATIERLRDSLVDPGNPMVDADTPSPYYSPWMVLLGALAKVSGLGTFSVLRIAAVVGLALLLTGIWRFTRTLSTHRAAPPLATLCLLLLWGPKFLIWSGFLGLTSLSLNISYPSTFALGLTFHFWALLSTTLRGSGWRGGRLTSRGAWAAYQGLGLLWALILLSHQFTGVVATFGALGLLLGARPWPAKETWLRLGCGIVVGLALLAAWPYYSFFSLFTIGGLEGIHRPLYRGLLLHCGFALIGVVALAFRWRRDRRDPLVIFFALGALMVGVGGLIGHWSWGRALPAVMIPAQLAAALAMVEGGRKAVRRAFVVVTGAALLAGAWAQSGALNFVVRADALPHSVLKGAWEPKAGYEWIMKWAERGDTVMVSGGNIASMVPAYGVYTVGSAYPDFFLPDEKERDAAVARYYAAGTPRQERLDILHRYKAKWVLQWRSQGGLPGNDPALRQVDTGPQGQVLYRVVD